MGMRSGTTFKKRQKEIARMEKQRDKAARRIQRKAEKLSGDSSTSEDDDLLETSDEPMGESDEVSVAAGETAPAGEPAPVHE
jgi:DNA anti-recombination protein RmuC